MMLMSQIMSEIFLAKEAITELLKMYHIPNSDAINFSATKKIK